MFEEAMRRGLKILPEDLEKLPEAEKEDAKRTPGTAPAEER
jgi:hypothetical protein